MGFSTHVHLQRITNTTHKEWAEGVFDTNAIDDDRHAAYYENDVVICALRIAASSFSI